MAGGSVVGRTVIAPGMMVMVVVLGASAAVAAPGDLDTTFGSGGRVTTDVASNEGAGGVAVQADGKIVVAGSTWREKTGGDFLVARYEPDGDLDPTFSHDGTRLTSFSSVYDAATDVAIQPNGKIVAVGTAAMESRFAVARYQPDGSLDRSFGSRGKVTTNVGPSDDFAFGVAIQPDGRIVVVGYTSRGDFAVVRYRSSGRLDRSFGGDGMVTTSLSKGWDMAYAVALQTNGKIVVVGRSDAGGGDFGIARYRADGTLDPSFGEGGIVTTHFSPDYDIAADVAIQPDGRIVVAGGTARRDGQLALARYERDGTLDSTFSGDGKLATDFGSLDHAWGVAIQPDGRSVAAGFTAAGTGDCALARYETDGALDTTFGGDGTQTTDFASDYDSCRGVAIQADGRIVAVGTTFGGPTGYDVALARYLSG